MDELFHSNCMNLRTQCRNQKTQDKLQTLQMGFIGRQLDHHINCPLDNRNYVRIMTYFHMELVLWHLYLFFLNSYSRGYSDGNFLKKFTAVDIATARRGYSDGSAWIQRRHGVDTVTARRGYSDGQAWI